MTTTGATSHPIRVLVVDDSPSARELLVRMLQGSGFAVVGTAQDGEEAVALARLLRPDVITMDIHMPHLNGIEATRRIMTESPVPIVVVSVSGEQQGGGLAFEAMQAGALAVLGKPPAPGHPQHMMCAQELARTVRLMADVQVVRRRSATAPRASDSPIDRLASTAALWPVAAAEAAPVGERLAQLRAAQPRPELIAIAASTGGPQAIQRVLRGLGGDLDVPILAVQHISRGFAAGMATWLTTTGPLPVQLAVYGERPRGGAGYLAPDDHHLIVTHDGTLALSKAPPVNGFRPSANVLFESVAECLGPRAIGIVLTGMGEDGATGLRRLLATGAATIAQDEASSVIYGMPRAAAIAGAARYVLPVAAIGPAVRTLLGVDSSSSQESMV